jgi:hypothetical protein
MSSATVEMEKGDIPLEEGPGSVAMSITSTIHDRRQSVREDSVPPRNEAIPAPRE